MNPPSSPPRARSVRTFVLSVLLGGLVLGTASFSCAPVAQRLAVPLACPSGTHDSAVVTHVTRNQRGTIVTEFELRCVDADGGSTAPPGMLVFGTMVLYGTGLALLVALVAFARRRTALAVATLALTTLAGCEFGTLTRDEFEDRYPYGAGPMFSRGRAEGAARALEALLGGPQRVTGVSVSPETVSFSVVGRGGVGDVDVYTYRDEGFGDPVPVQTSEYDRRDDAAFPLVPADLGRVNALVREAPARVGIEGGHVSSLSLSKNGAALEFYSSVESDHRRGIVRHDLRGAVIEARID